MNYMAPLFATHEAIAKEKVMRGTFGHLMAKGTRYKGKVVIACTPQNQPAVIKENVPVDGSPWWFEAIQDFAFEVSRVIDEETIFIFNIEIIAYPSKHYYAIKEIDREEIKIKL